MLLAPMVLELGWGIFGIFGKELIMLTRYGRHTQMVEGTFHVLAKETLYSRSVIHASSPSNQGHSVCQLAYIPR